MSCLSSLIRACVRTLIQRTCTLIAALVVVVGHSVGAEDSADPVAATLSNLQQANEARAEEARLISDWRIERDRLAALIAATKNETDRLARDAAQEEAARDDARTRLAALGDGNELATVQARLGNIATTIHNSLTQLNATMPPGTVSLPISGLSDEAAFDASMRALDATEQAATAVAVEVVNGQRDGTATAVKLLRVAGAAAWWLSLDGKDAGTAHMRDGTLILNTTANADERIAIAQAITQAEGRLQPTITVLPAPPALFKIGKGQP